MKKCLCALVLLLLVGLCGCGGVRPASDAVLVGDLENYIKAHSYLEYLDDGEECAIRGFEVIKRKTSSENGVDEVYVKAVIEAPDGSMQTNSEFTMIYEKYNDGWQLESMEETSRQVVPLIEPEGFEEEIEDSVRYRFKYFNMSDFTVYDKSVDVERGWATWSVRAHNDRGYLTEDLDAVAYLSFVSDGYEGGYWDLDWNIGTNSETRTWDQNAIYDEGYYELTDDERILYGDRPDEVLHLLDLKDYSEYQLMDEFFGGWHDLQYTGMDYSTIRYAFVGTERGRKSQGVPILLFGANENDIWHSDYSYVRMAETLLTYPVSVTR